jgi:hypothetical protein
MDLEGTTTLVTGNSGDTGGSSHAVLGRAASAHGIAAQVVTFCQAESVTEQVLVVDGAVPGGMQ